MKPCTAFAVVLVFWQAFVLVHSSGELLFVFTCHSNTAKNGIWLASCSTMRKKFSSLALFSCEFSLIYSIDLLLPLGVRMARRNSYVILILLHSGAMLASQLPIWNEFFLGWHAQLLRKPPQNRSVENYLTYQIEVFRRTLLIYWRKCYSTTRRSLKRLSRWGIL